MFWQATSGQSPTHTTGFSSTTKKRIPVSLVPSLTPSFPLDHRWFSGGVASLLSRGLCLMQLCAKYRQVSVSLSRYHQCWKIKEAASLKEKMLPTRWKVRCTAASWLHACPLQVRCFIGIWKTSIDQSTCHLPLRNVNKVKFLKPIPKHTKEIVRLLTYHRSGNFRR